MTLSTLARRLYIQEPLAQLTCSNALYADQVRAVIASQLQFDRAEHDVTTQVTARDQNKIIMASITAKQDGVIAGVEEVVWFLKNEKKITVVSSVKNGSRVKKGREILKIRGSVADLMSHERTILNLIGHLSGIATRTKALTTKNGPLLASTRKTRFGLLDKKACVLGGGGAHRLHLADAVLIKHNHLHAAQVESSPAEFTRFLKASYAKAQMLTAVRFFEIEVTTDVQLCTAAAFFETAATPRLPVVIMLDNFPAATAARLMKKLAKIHPKRPFLIECSGGITSENLSQYCKVGADVLSLGSLIYDASFLDVSMKVASR